MATYKKKGPNVTAMPVPVEQVVYACVCYGCDQYFWVARGPLVRQIRCPVCNATKSDAECLGVAKAQITMIRV